MVTGENSGNGIATTLSLAEMNAPVVMDCGDKERREVAQK